jgi:hypothetical protein
LARIEIFAEFRLLSSFLKSEVNAITSSYEKRKLHSFLAIDENQKLHICLAYQAPDSSKKARLFPRWTRLDKFASKLKEIDKNYVLNHVPENKNYCDKLKGMRNFFCQFKFWNQEKDKNDSDTIARKEWEEKVSTTARISEYRTFNAILGDSENGDADFETDGAFFDLMLATSKYFSIYPEETGSKNSCPNPG